MRRKVRKQSGKLNTPALDREALRLARILDRAAEDSKMANGIDGVCG